MIRSGATPWLRFAGRRAARFVVGAGFLVVASFLMIHAIPGDPVRGSLGAQAPPELIEQRRAELRLDRPLYDQFGSYVSDLARLDFGESIKTGTPVSDVIGERMANTAKLAAVSFGLVVVLGISLGLILGAWTATGRRRKLELGFVFATGTITAIPEYLMGALLVAVFALWLGALPAAGMVGLDSFVLPALALALAPACFLARIVRLETVSVLSREYMTTARSKQLPTRILYARHAVPNILTSSLTIAGVIFGGLLGGSVIIERIFDWPGIGTAVVGAILDKDYPIVQACVLILGLTMLLVNTLVDVALVLINPRLAMLKDS